MREVWPAPDVVLGPRVVVLCHFDPEGAVRDDLMTYLAELAACGFAVVVVSNGQLDNLASSRLRRLCTAVLERRNLGYDFGAWRDAMETLGLPRPDTECLLLANDSVYGPFAPLRPVLDRIDFARADVWSMTDSREIGYHLQSYFLAFGAAALRHKTWRDFWRSVRPVPSKQWTIRHCEIGLSRHLGRAGLRMAALFSTTEFNGAGPPINPCIGLWRELLAAGDPFLKRELLRDNPADDRGVDAWRNSVLARFGEACASTIGAVEKDLAAGSRVRPRGRDL